MTTANVNVNFVKEQKTQTYWSWHDGYQIDKLINKIKKHCEEKIKVKVTICDDSQIANNVLNYMNLFYNN